MKCLLSVFALLLVLTTQTLPIAAAEKHLLIVVDGPTVVAFFPPVTDTELQKNPDTNEALADFQLYANRVREPFKKRGIEVHELYTRSFRIRVGKNVNTFHPKTGVGYYFVIPGKRPLIEYGVMTDIDLLHVADQYFGPVAGK